eukprot:4068876-Pleurochrysis_carterae.AAC.1
MLLHRVHRHDKLGQRAKHHRAAVHAVHPRGDRRAAVAPARLPAERRKGADGTPRAARHAHAARRPTRCVRRQRPSERVRRTRLAANAAAATVDAGCGVVVGRLHRGAHRADALERARERARNVRRPLAAAALQRAQQRHSLAGDRAGRVACARSAVRRGGGGESCSGGAA